MGTKKQSSIQSEHQNNLGYLFEKAMYFADSTKSAFTIGVMLQLVVSALLTGYGWAVASSQHTASKAFLLYLYIIWSPFIGTFICLTLATILWLSIRKRYLK